MSYQDAIYRGRIRASSSSIVDGTKAWGLVTHGPLSIKLRIILPRDRSENPDTIAILHVVLRNTIAGGIGISCAWKITQDST